MTNKFREWLLCKVPPWFRTRWPMKRFYWQKVDVGALKKRMPRAQYGRAETTYMVDSRKYAYGWNDCIDHLAATGRLVQGWQPIETAPMDGTEVLLFCPKERKKVLEGYADYEMQEYYWTDLSGDLHEPTHWQPLPAPPQEEK